MEKENTGCIIPFIPVELIEKRKQDWSEFFSRIEASSNSYDEGISINSSFSKEYLSDSYSMTVTSTSKKKPTKKKRERKKNNRNNIWRLLCKKYSLRHNDKATDTGYSSQEIVTSNCDEENNFKNSDNTEERKQFSYSKKIFYDGNDKRNEECESQLDIKCNAEVKSILNNFLNDSQNVEEIINEQPTILQNINHNSIESTFINSTNKRKASETPATNKKKKIRLKTLYFYSDDIEDKQIQYNYCNSTPISWEDFLNDNF